MTSNPLFSTLHLRGFFNQCTDEDGLAKAILEHQSASKPFAVYLGIDPTASSLHIGHTLPLYMLKHLQDLGLQIVVLVGGGTGRIGDPSGKNQARQLLSDEAIASNAELIKKQCMRFFQGNDNVRFLNNATWLNELHYIDFLRDIGRHFSVNRMLSFDAYASRLESGLSFIEFNYQLLQSYDFEQLFQRENCRLQIGGQDQWGNIVAGIDLIRRMHNEETFGLTCPLIMTSTGQKMGKSEQGAIFLDANLTSPSEFYQYWRNCSDADVGRFLKLFTFLPLEICDELVAQKDVTSLSHAKDRLALEVTTIIHGEEIARQVQEQMRILFDKSSENSQERVQLIISQAKAQLNHAQLNATSTGVAGSHGGMSYSTITLQQLEDGLTFADLFVQAKLSTSKGEYRKKLVAASAAYCNEEAIIEADKVVNVVMFIDNALLLRAGKKRYHLVMLES
ncbi:tyrosine--tRNA ligase [Entomospira entomophila]|uniref:Tyrosine--tRNA ligase n=1 Tax=Entomospira entomophila TaxID=2719988 RepID=A0A968KTA9_9SPIO|nr:tyrosine--tRNA ligase [Entomospira entomophilus]NIZ40111.1 tyrosine--tRNA ligase [Entomospira entomophilus]WDI35671.1 tyrosine--tRNA ligase [Entomospira entomophilus]